MTGKNFIIVQHMAWEGPGQHLVSAMKENGVSYQIVEAWHEPLPPVAAFDGMIVLGGSPNVDEEEEFPYLRPLKERIREVVATGRAYLGFCLGHQLLAHVLGLTVGPLPRKSVGFMEGLLTDKGMAHPMFQGLPVRFTMFKWHGQGIMSALPPGQDILATSAAGVEALGLDGNPRVVGLQFDNHAGAQDVQQWLEHDREWALSGTEVIPEDLIAAAKSQEEAMGLEFRRLMRNFLRL
jgi:GMP synthase-like glutamine amidotransferase